VIRWTLSVAVLSVWVAFVGTALYVAIYEAPDTVPDAGAIVVLGAAADDAGKMNAETAERLARGLALYDAGKAPLLVVSGGGEPPVALAMAEAALAAGVPADAILAEAGSHSTLQNALFTADFADIDKEAPILLVTQRYHLPRAWASFRWAGFRDVTRVAADPGAGFVLSMPLVQEAVKWPLNVLRAAAASAAMAGNVPRESFIKYLE
jgi:uncharacterized SAM-binding protein YcdF (DUF218 family)